MMVLVTAKCGKVAVLVQTMNHDFNPILQQPLHPSSQQQTSCLFVSSGLRTYMYWVKEVHSCLCLFTVLSLEAAHSFLLQFR